MTLVSEIEEAITKLPIKEAYMLRHWLNEFEATREYKKLQEQTQAAQPVAQFRHDHGSTLLN